MFSHKKRIFPTPDIIILLLYRPLRLLHIAKFEIFLHLSDMQHRIPHFDIRFNTGAVHHCTADWSWAPRAMVDFDLWLVCAGRGELTARDIKYPLGAGDCFLFRPGHGCVARHNPQRPLTVIAIHFDCLPRPEEDACPNFPRFHQTVENLHFTVQLLKRSIQAGRCGNQQVAAVWLAAALAEIAGSQRTAIMPENHYTKPLEKLCRGITERPAASWRVGEMAASMHICPDHFSRLFQAQAGMSPSEFVIHSRIELARNLLLSSSHQIARVAELAGYRNIHYFSRQFKAKTGTTPSQYRQRKRKNEA